MWVCYEDGTEKDDRPSASKCFHVVTGNRDPLSSNMYNNQIPKKKKYITEQESNQLHKHLHW